MSASEGFVEFLKDTMRGLGPVSVRRMFGGAGIYADGVMFGLIADDTLYHRLNDVTVCYRCHAELRGFVPSESHGPFDMHTAEEYEAGD